MAVGLTRRRLLGAAAVTVAGFDPLARAWVARGAEPPSPFASAPPLDGTLHLDEGTRRGDSRDQGNIVTRMPGAVLRPGSVRDVQRMVVFCREHAIPVAARGQAHTTHGHGLVDGGLVIETRSLARIHSIGPEGADVDAGVLWRELLEAAHPLGLTPPAVTGYTKLSVGGTLSVGGVGCQTTNRTGLQMERVQELEVVTGTGDRVVCSRTRRRDLFGATLGGLGQCGVITRAKVDLVPARQRAVVWNLQYTDPSPFFRDFRTLLYRGELDSVYNIWVPFGTNLVYQLQAVAFYDGLVPPDRFHLLRGLTQPPLAATAKHQSYLEYLFIIDDVFDGYKAAAGFDALVKPWLDVWLPESAVEPYVSEVVAELTPEDVGPTGFLLILPQLRGSVTLPFYPVPDVPEDEFVYLFDVLTSSALPGPDAAFADRMLARNRRLYDAARAAGGTRYAIGSLDFDAADWRAHYGVAWRDFERLKRRFDPAGILTPGLGIF